MGKQQSKRSRKEGRGDSCLEAGDTEPLESLPKRNNCPGVRVVGGRIYDSELGKTCHQCRQKTLDFVASCKHVREDRPCTIKFCHKCLLNRYGEKAEEVDKLKDWNCPKCRSICNCSVCMKKRGVRPTGNLFLHAKASGFSSVSDMLNIESNGVCAKKTAAVTKETVVASPRKRGKENAFHGNSISKVHAPKNPDPDKRKPKRKKQEGSQDVHAAGEDGGTFLKKHSPQKARLNKDKKDKKNRNHDIKPKPTKKEDDEEKNDTFCILAEDLEETNNHDAQLKPKGVVNYRKLKDPKKIEERGSKCDIILPQGDELFVVAGIELPHEAVGDALQFLEFCAAFREIFDIGKGQPECILRELMRGRRGRGTLYSSAAQFHIKLLSFVMDSGEESPSLNSENGNNAWLQALGKCISESRCSFKEFPDSVCFDQGGYDKLDSPKKLKLLNFLCDEALGTTDMRTWVEDQHKIFLAKKKEAKEKVFAARDKEKSMKRKLQDEVAKAIIAKNGAPLSMSEHGAIVSQIKAAANQAHVEYLEAIDVEAMEKQGSDVIRTDPILLDDNGKVFWRLKGYSSEPHILVQDTRCQDAVVPSEKWYTYTVEKMLMVEKYISSLRARKV